MSVNKYTTASGLQTLANGQRIWIGTKDAYNAAKQAGILPINCLIAITDDSEDNNYSTEEKLTGKFWIDDKPIYRKVFVIDSISSGTEVDVSSLNIETLIVISGFGFDGGVNEITLPFYDGATMWSIYYRSNAGMLHNKSSRNVTNVNIILEYTKTTD